jgi:hypothetical protein
MGTTLPVAAINEKKQAIISGKIIPGIAAVPISKQLDDTLKRARTMYPRVQIVLQNIIKQQKLHQDSNEWSYLIKKIMNGTRCFQNQQRSFSKSIRKTVTVCQEVAEDRKKHIKAIELSRAKRIYDNLHEYQMHVIEVQGKEEYENFIKDVKQELFGIDNMLSKETEQLEKYQNVLT